MIIIEGDTLIQPRMYLDNGFELTDKDGNPRIMSDDGVTVVGSPDDADGDPDAEIIKGQKRGVKSVEKDAEKSAENPRVGAGDAHAQSKRVGVRDINNINDKDSIGGVGEFRETSSVKNKTDNNNPECAETARISPDNTEAGNVPAHKEKSQQKPPKTEKRATVEDNPPTLEEVQTYFDEMAAKGKPFLYITPDGFYDACEQSGWRLKDGKPMISWKARVRTFESFRKEHGDRPIGSQQRQRQRKDDIPKSVTEDNFDGQETW